jgi:hypothetical protein
MNTPIQQNTVAPEPGRKPKRAQGPHAAAAQASEQTDTGTLPPSVRDRFVQVGERYYFPDQTLAFTDKGVSLKADSNNAAVVQALVEIAQARGWSAVQVKGAEDFRRLVWQQASRRGIEVTGYQPSDIERAALARDKSRPMQPRDPAQQPTQEAPSGTGQPPSDQRTSGQLLEAGAAHYRFDPKQGQSYYVKLRTESGERILWGIDLERALVESRSNVKIGDPVTVENRGSQPVKVKVPQRDAQGSWIADQTITTRRNSWRIETTRWYAEQAERAEALRNGEAAKREIVLRFPDMINAVVGLWLGEQFADRRIEKPEDRERVVDLIKERIATAVQRGEQINAPLLKREVARKLDAMALELDEVAQREREIKAVGARDRGQPTQAPVRG